MLIGSSWPSRHPSLLCFLDRTHYVTCLNVFMVIQKKFIVEVEERESKTGRQCEQRFWRQECIEMCTE